MKIPNCILSNCIGSVTNGIVIGYEEPLSNPADYPDNLFDNEIAGAKSLKEDELLKIGLEYLLNNPEILLWKYADTISGYDWSNRSELEMVLREILKRGWPKAPPTSPSVLNQVELTNETMREWRDKQRREDWTFLINTSIDPNLPETTISNNQLIVRFQSDIEKRTELYALMVRRANKNEKIKALLFDAIGYLQANPGRYLITLHKIYVPILFILEWGDDDLKLVLKNWLTNNWSEGHQRAFLNYMEKDEDKYPIIKEMLS